MLRPSVSQYASHQDILARPFQIAERVLPTFFPRTALQLARTGEAVVQLDRVENTGLQEAGILPLALIDTPPEAAMLAAQIA